MELTLEQLISECERRGLKIEQPPLYRNFTVTARYDRGFGPEYITLSSVTAQNIKEAQLLANGQAKLHFELAEGHENTSVNEVRIRPQ